MCLSGEGMAVPGVPRAKKVFGELGPGLPTRPLDSVGLQPWPGQPACLQRGSVWLHVLVCVLIYLCIYVYLHTYGFRVVHVHVACICTCTCMVCVSVALDGACVSAALCANIVCCAGLRATGGYGPWAGRKRHGGWPFPATPSCLSLPCSGVLGERGGWGSSTGPSVPVPQYSVSSTPVSDL